MLQPGFYNMDCMEGMKEFPDKFFDLAVVDPPYGDASASTSGSLQGGGGRLFGPKKEPLWRPVGVI